MWTNGVEKITDLMIANDLWHISSVLTFFTLTALIICGASLEIIQREECEGTGMQLERYLCATLLFIYIYRFRCYMSKDFNSLGMLEREWGNSNLWLLTMYSTCFRFLHFSYFKKYVDITNIADVNTHFTTENNIMDLVSAPCPYF